MKVISFILITFCYLTEIEAQTLNYKHFKVDVNTGVGSSKSAVGFAMTVEPKYNFSNNFSAGLRWENAQMYSLKESSGTNRTSGPDGWVNSFVLVGEFYAWQDLIRPFIGGGTGIYLANFDVAQSQNVSAKMGFVLRGGVQIGHLRLVVENNFIPDESHNLNYFNLKVGTTLGGGKK